MSSDWKHLRVGVLGRLSIRPDCCLSGSLRRVLAYLAVRGPVVPRPLMSMQLWPDTLETKARANLRQAIWQLPDGWVHASTSEVRLCASTDLTEARRVADLALAATPLDGAQLGLLTEDLLPGWYDDWLLDEQQWFHLQRLQALEAACRSASELGQHAIATRAGLAAVCAEPLRHSSVVALVQAHLREGNTYEAVRRFERYRELLWREIGVEPGDELTGLLQPVL